VEKGTVGGEWTEVVRLGGEGAVAETQAKGSRGCGSMEKKAAAGSFVRVWERRGEGSRWCGSVEKGAVAETLIGMRERDERLEGDERE
jgi:hypothetical protein